MVTLDFQSTAINKLTSSFRDQITYNLLTPYLSPHIDQS